MKLTLIFGLFFFSSVVFAQMVPGNLIISRVGDGSNSLNSNAHVVSLVELLQTGSNTAQSTTSFNSSSSGTRLTNSGSATSEGGFTLSFNGKYLIHAGYNAQQGTSSVAGSNTSSVTRTFGRVDRSFTIDLTTTTTNYSTNNIRGTTSETGNEVYAGGTGTGDGFRYHSAIGNTGAMTSIGGISGSTNVRWPEIFGSINSSGQVVKGLYGAGGAGTSRGVYLLGSVGTSLPTSSASPTLVGGQWSASNASPYGFLLLDADPNVEGVDLLYVVDDGSGTGTLAGIHKYSFDGTTWTARGSLTNNSPFFSFRGIQGYITSSGRVKLFITRATGTGSLATILYQFYDNASYNNSLAPADNSNNTLTSSNFTSNATNYSLSTSNYGYRGLAWAPTDFSSQPTNSTICSGTNTNFGVAMYSGDSARYEYFWQRSLDNGSSWTTISSSTDGSIYSNFSTATLSITGTPNSINNYQYRCVVRYMSQYFLVSNAAILTVNTSPVITLDPSSFDGCTNQSYTLTGSATNASSYQWRYNSSNIPLANSTSYTLNPASASNSGTYDIIAINGSCSDTSAVAIVNISDKITTYPYQDALNSGADCYSTQAVSGSAIWTKTTSMSTGLTPSTGQMYVYPSSTASSGSAAALVTPTFDLTSISNPILTFRWAKSNTNTTAKDSVTISYSNDNFATTNFIRTAYRVHTGINWQTNHITLASLGGLNNVQFKFTGYAYGGGADLALDSIAVYESQCPEVSGESSSVSNNLVTLSWTSAPSTTYELRHKPSTSSTWTAYSPSPVTSPVSFYLNPNTTYEWQVRSICVDNAYGWPVSNETFTTGTATVNCLQVSGLQQTVTNCSTAIATWNNTSTADSFVVRLWKYNTNTSVWVVVSNTILTNTYSLTFNNLLASKDYRWRVIRYCNGVALNSAQSTFSTPSCRMAGTNSDEFISEVALYPNPNSGSFNLTFPSVGETYALTITDLNGRVVESRSGISENGVTSLQIQVPNLASGLYFLTLTNSGNTVTKKLTIQ